MAGGSSYKWQGSAVRVVTGFETLSSASAISAITKANQCAVTSNAHGLANGAIIKLNGIKGMTELNGGVYIVDNATINTFELYGVDSTGYGTYTTVGGTGNVYEALMSNFCELTDYNRQGGSAPEIDTTSLCSVAAEHTLGLPDYGTAELDYNFAPKSAIQVAMHQFDASKAVTGIHVYLPLSGGEMVMLGAIQQTSEQAGNGAVWKGKVTMRLSGPRYDVGVD